MIARQQCAFVQFTSRMAAELAAERSFQKLIIHGRRLNIKWGRSQARMTLGGGFGEGEGKKLDPVPGLPGGRDWAPSGCSFCICQAIFMNESFLPDFLHCSLASTS